MKIKLLLTTFLSLASLFSYVSYAQQETTTDQEMPTLEDAQKMLRQYTLSISDFCKKQKEKKDQAIQNGTEQDEDVVIVLVEPSLTPSPMQLQQKIKKIQDMHKLNKKLSEKEKEEALTKAVTTFKQSQKPSDELIQTLNDLSASNVRIVFVVGFDPISIIAKPDNVQTLELNKKFKSAGIDLNKYTISNNPIDLMYEVQVNEQQKVKIPNIYSNGILLAPALCMVGSPTILLELLEMLFAETKFKPSTIYSLLDTGDSFAVFNLSQAMSDSAPSAAA